MAASGVHEGTEPAAPKRVPVHVRLRRVLIGRGAVLPLATAQGLAAAGGQV